MNSNAVYYELFSRLGSPEPTQGLRKPKIGGATTTLDAERIPHEVVRQHRRVMTMSGGD
jgi:hypothetical protein